MPPLIACGSFPLMPPARPRARLSRAREIRGSGFRSRARTARSRRWPASSSGQVVLRDDRAFEIVRIAIVLAVAEALHQRRRRVAQMKRHRQRAELARILARALHRAIRGVRLGRARQIGHALRERNDALGQPDEVHRVLDRDRDLQRARIGVADVLGREDHHPPRDEQRILARLDHAHHPVQRRVGIAAAHALDERGDDVVVLLARAIVEQRLVLRGLAHVLGRDLGRCPRAARARRRSPAC